MARDRARILLPRLAGAICAALVVEAARAEPAPKPRATPHANTTSRSTAKPWSCPQAMTNSAWASLVFPACPGYAYHASYALPDDHPCKVTIDTDGAGRMVVRHRYDARKRWVSESVDGALVQRCSYDADHLAWCDSIRLQGDGAGESSRTTAIYDHDRLVRLATVRNGKPETVQAFHYNDAGDIDTVTAGVDVVQLDYDANHRIIAERHQGDTTRYTYDTDAARVAARNNERFTYDKRGRLTTVDDGSSSDAIAYDQRGRVASITSSFGTRHTFAYCD